MKPLQLGLALSFALGSVVLACSSSSSSGGNPPDGGGPADHATNNDAPSCGAPNPGNCVQPGAMGNELGIGAYCTKGCMDCPAPPPGGVLICSVDYGAPAQDAFCTKPCSVNSDCGSGAMCIVNPLGTGCAPIQCIPADAGIGTDSGSDSGSGDSAPADAPAG